MNQYKNACRVYNHKSNNCSSTNMLYDRVYKKVDPLECFLIRSDEYI